MSVNRIITVLIFLIVSGLSFAQSVETGFVKEYNGEKEKTPLAGVELNISGAPSTVSDSQGHYELKFAVLKPGEEVKYNEIYKTGFVIFNTEQLKSWRISNNKKPFIIVMCKEAAFRELRNKYHGIIERSYLAEYQRQVAIAQKKSSELAKMTTDKEGLKIINEKLQSQITNIENDYKSKLKDINTYVEIFARIDRSEMDSIEAQALRMVDEGRIDEGIQLYEEQRLLQKTEEQLAKWESGVNMQHTAEKMMEESQQDLILLAGKMKKQIGLYQMGGKEYDEKRFVTVRQLISLYANLNKAQNGMFNEEQGEWTIRLINETVPKLDDRINGYKEAADIPSYWGVSHLGRTYEIPVVGLARTFRILQMMEIRYFTK